MSNLSTVPGLLLAFSLGLPAHGALAVQRECVGYYTIDMPGHFEYALSRKTFPAEAEFSNGLTAWGAGAGLKLEDGSSAVLSITQRSTDDDLQKLLAFKNDEPLRKKNELLKLIEDIDEQKAIVDPTGENRKLMVQSAAKVVFYEQVPGTHAFVWPATDRENVFALTNDHILIGRSLVVGDSRTRVKDFVAQFKPRSAYELPLNGDACIPFFRVLGDHALDSIDVSMQLIDRPDIVISLQESDASTEVEDPKKFIVNATQPGRTFVGSVEAKPLDRIRPTHALRIDGREGLGAFAQVRREGALANTADKDLDWAFIGYVPGQAGSKPGQSYDITLKVERFGRFARQPMTEAEFRALVERIAQGIAHRPDPASPR